jgi:hypothetical protein
MSSGALPAEAEELRSWTERLAVGSIKVLSATAQPGEDAAGEPAVFFDVVLPTPEPEAGTWPIDDVLALHDEIDRKARQLRMPSAGTFGSSPRPNPTPTLRTPATEARS